MNNESVNPNAGQAALAEAVQLAETRLPQLDSGDPGALWHHWLIAHILLREARALIEKK